MMNEHLIGLKQYWEDYPKPQLATQDELKAFEIRTGLIIPSDLKEYFLYLNGKSHEWDNSFVQFYSLDQFVSLHEEIGDFGGIPDYKDLINWFPGYKDYYVFAEHAIHVFVYAIRLYPEQTDVNEVYNICGNTCELRGNSFNEFLKNYLDITTPL